jgi:hypothetical protein
MEFASNYVTFHLILSLDMLAGLSREQSLPPKSVHKHVAVQVVSNTVHDGSWLPEGPVKLQRPCPEHSLSNMRTRREQIK